MLKIKNIICIVFVLFFLAGCTEEVDFRQLKEINGLLYKIHDEEPFSGRTLNYPVNSGRLVEVPSICVVDIKNGLYDGVMRCKSNGIELYVGEYKAGLHNGNEESISLNGSKHYTRSWNNGLRNGVEKLYNAKTGLVYLETTYLNGEKEGSEKKWAEDGKTKILDLVWKDGKRSGFSLEGTIRRDGYQKHVYYRDGKPHGLVKSYRSFKGEEFLGAEYSYKDGQKDGDEIIYIRPGKIQEKNIYKNDLLMKKEAYEYSAYGEGDLIGQYELLRIDNPDDGFDSPYRYKTSLVYDGVQKGKNKAGDFFYDIKWDKGIVIKAEAHKLINGKKVLLYKGVGVRKTGKYGMEGENNRVDIERVSKDGIENVFHGDEFVGQVVWDKGVGLASAIKYNKIYPVVESRNLRKKVPDTIFIVTIYESHILNHKNYMFTVPSEFLLRGYSSNNFRDELGFEKLDSYKDNILNTESFMNLDKPSWMHKNKDISLDEMLIDVKS